MDDAFARRHPLHPTVPQQTFVAGAVAVTHTSGNHISDGLESSMRVIRKTANIVVRVIGTEAVEHQEGIQPFLQIRSEERREGNECVSKVSSRRSPSH